MKVFVFLTLLLCVAGCNEGAYRKRAPEPVEDVRPGPAMAGPGYKSRGTDVGGKARGHEEKLPVIDGRGNHTKWWVTRQDAGYWKLRPVMTRDGQVGWRENLRFSWDHDWRRMGYVPGD